MQRVRMLIMCVVSAVLLCLTATANAGQTYGFATVATSNANGGLGLSLPSINDNGTVAFVDTSPGKEGLYTGNGGLLTTLVSSFEEFHLYYAGGPGAPTINNAGTIAYWAYVGPSGGSSSDVGILSTTSGTIVSYPPPVGSASGFSYSYTPSISADGTVAFAVTHVVASNGGGIFTGNGSPLTTIISNSAAAPVADPSISHNNLIAYDWPDLSGNSRNGDDTLYLKNGNTTTNLGTISADFFSNIAVNNSGTVIASTLGHKVYLASGGLLTPIVNNNGTFSEDDAVSINDSGQYAFFADLAAGGSGIFTGPDPVLDKVVETGDPLAGSTIVSLGFASEGLNNSGQIAFWADLANGEQGEFVASVPEPSSGIIMVIILCGVLLARLPFSRTVSHLPLPK